MQFVQASPAPGAVVLYAQRRRGIVLGIERGCALVAPIRPISPIGLHRSIYSLDADEMAALGMGMAALGVFMMSPRQICVDQLMVLSWGSVSLAKRLLIRRRQVLETEAIETTAPIASTFQVEPCDQGTWKRTRLRTV
ncbi:hypothetical protein [Granulibacter bethesdensis]|uniref:hypothetical protein n=1 Tax=Granulibacter bethesdensis TaxID=364410 RepID=UPI0003F1F17B|nr:hypothetical protein [Granulibacter bethesdensis]AHJ69351.1 Hypothetical protein GbCGDNIH2_7300 [Granulibacter bethesdensis]